VSTLLIHRLLEDNDFSAVSAASRNDAIRLWPEFPKELKSIHCSEKAFLGG